MPIVGAGVLALIAIMLSASLTGTTPEPEVVVTATAGQNIERPHFEYEKLPRVEVISETPKVAEVIRAAPVPRPKVARTVEIQATPVPTPPPPPPPPAPPTPTVDPAVSVCLGRFVGTECSFTEDGVSKDGTCMTLAWKPVTCVPHTP